MVIHGISICFMDHDVEFYLSTPSQDWRRPCGFASAHDLKRPFSSSWISTRGTLSSKKSFTNPGSRVKRIIFCCKMASSSSSNDAEKSSQTPQLAPLSAADLSSAGFLSDFLGLTPATSSSSTVKTSNPVKTYQVSLPGKQITGKNYLKWSVINGTNGRCKRFCVGLLTVWNATRSYVEG